VSAKVVSRVNHLTSRLHDVAAAASAAAADSDSDSESDSEPGSVTMFSGSFDMGWMARIDGYGHQK